MTIEQGPPVKKYSMPPGKVPLLPEWHAAWVAGDRLMPNSTPNNIHLGLAVLQTVRHDRQAVGRFVNSDFDDDQLNIERLDAIDRHNRFGIPFMPRGDAGPGQTAYDVRPKADIVLNGTRINIMSTLYEFSLGEAGQTRRHDPVIVLPDVEAFLAEQQNLDTTIVLFEAAKTALHTRMAHRARGAFLRGMNLRATGKPSAPVSADDVRVLMTAVTPIYAEHIIAAGRELDVPDGQLRTFTRNVINPNFEQGPPEYLEV